MFTLGFTSQTRSEIPTILAGIGRTPAAQAYVNLDNAMRILAMLPATCVTTWLETEITKVQAGGPLSKLLDTLEDMVTTCDGMHMAPSCYVPHPVVVLRAEIKNAHMYLSTLN